MEHSENYEKVKKYYEKGWWKLQWVRNAVVRGRITEDEFKEITGLDYDQES